MDPTQDPAAASSIDQPAIKFAWCFSHGRLHRFVGEPWCTASWMPLFGKTEESAMGAKQRAWGDAQFVHELPDDKQMIVISFSYSPWSLSRIGQEPGRE